MSSAPNTYYIHSISMLVHVTTHLRAAMYKIPRNGIFIIIFKRDELLTTRMNNYEARFFFSIFGHNEIFTIFKENSLTGRLNIQKLTKTSTGKTPRWENNPKIFYLKFCHIFNQSINQYLFIDVV